MNCTLEKAAKLLLESNDFIFLCHKSPDGDTLGSAYALKYALEAVGKRAEVLCADEIPERLKFITELSESGRTRDPEREPLVCAIDVAEPHMLGKYAEVYAGRIGLKIDHHPNGSEYAAYNYIDGRAAACAEIIYKILCRLSEMRGCVINEGVCTALYTALSSDTGCFRYSNVTANTMRIGAELIEGGADNYGVNHRLFELKTRAEIRARGMMINETEYHLDGRLAFLLISQAFRAESGGSDDDIGGLVSEMREVEGVELAITLKQDMQDETKFKISMRSGLGIKANELCAMFGGGGHDRAAGGAIVAFSPEAAKKEVLSRVIEALEGDK